MSVNYTQALKRYLNQTAVLEKCAGHDEYGKAEYSEGVEIAVRKVPMQKLVVDAAGKQIVSQMTVLTHADVGVEDLVDGERVLSVEWSVDRWGKNIALQVMV